MVRVLDIDTQTAIRASGSLRPRNFVVVTAKDRETGDPSVRCFWDDVEPVSVDVVDENGDLVSRDFAGDGAILSCDPIPMRIGLEVRTIELALSILHSEVEALVRGDDPRGAVVEIYRGLLTDGNKLVAAPRIRFLGKVNEAPIEVDDTGADSTVRLRIVSHTRELTRTNPAKKSDEQQKLRSGDRFRRYVGTMGDRDIRWGEAKA